jgi:hypothetical protein
VIVAFGLAGVAILAWMYLIYMGTFVATGQFLLGYLTAWTGCRFQLKRRLAVDDFSSESTS